MRNTFITALVELAENDERILLLTGDLGFSVVEQFAERFPGRFFNVGVAEQNMLGLATGLAEGGFIPYVYSIATFAVLRPYEFIRNGPVAHRLPVRIVGVGGGFDYGAAGGTHHALEDIALTRALPGLTIISPCDAPQAASALRQTAELAGPVYFRLGKDDRVVISEVAGAFRLGKPERIGNGREVILAGTGSIAGEAVAARELLCRSGVNASALLFSTLQPMDRSALLAELQGVRCIVSVEAHSIAGGLGSLLAEFVTEERLPIHITRLGARVPPQATGSQRYLERLNGLAAEQIADTARSLL